MANPLNLYATKVFSEHPLGLWALDDKADYISFLSDSDQQLSNWTSTGVTSIVNARDDQVFSLIPPSFPFSDRFANGVITDPTNNGLVTFTSPFAINPADVNAEQQTFSASAYVYSFDKILDFRVGFRYTDPDTSEVNEVIKAAALSSALAWAAVSETFILPTSFQDLELIFEIYYEDQNSSYEFSINGITAGQWAEEFQLRSFGAQLIDVPDSIAIQATKGIEAQPYGLPGTNGYYIADDNALVARNYGLPLVFGSQNATYLTPKANSPSLIVPGFGFMNRSGQLNRLTAEFWIKIKSSAIVARRIFGPIQSTDGLYVEGPFLKLRIGNQVVSHFIREWDRPMLVDIRLSATKGELIINGAILLELDLDPSSYAFPASIEDGLDQDWLGFYAYEDVPLIQIDCVGVYPYEVAAIVAKRRWIYGQGVQVPVDIKGLDSSSSVFVDYPFAKYPKNFYFPSSSRWANGSLENLVTERDALGPPNHPTPTVRFTDKTESRWLSDLEASQDLENLKITLKPNGSWDSTGGHLSFPNMNFLQEQTRSFYGVFESKEISLSKQTLFQVTNSTTSNTVEVYYRGNPIGPFLDNSITVSQLGQTVTVSGIRHGLKTGMKILIEGSQTVPTGFYQIFVISDTSLSYQVQANQATTIEAVADTDLIYAYDSTIYYSFITKLANGSFKDTIFYTAPGHSVGKKFMAGIHLPRFVRQNGRELGNFFGSRQNLAIYIAGSENLANTFSGYIYRIGFTSARNLKKISHLFNEDGIPVDYENVFEHFGPSIYDAGDEYFGNDPDYWELALDGGDPYDFQAIRAIDHIATYTLLPKINMGMFMLDIAVNSFWEDYVPLSYFSKEIVNAFGRKQSRVDFLQVNLDYPNMKIFNSANKYDTSQNLVKAYVAFQYLRDGSNSVEDNFTSKQLLDSSGIVRPNSSWLNTKYEVVDGTIVYPPPNVNFKNISINLYLEYEIDGIRFSPVTTRSLQISSQAFSNSPNKIGTKFGTNLVPFRKVGRYFDYRSAPPFAIYKGSSPYLYNTSNSGIEVRTTYDNRNNAGISIPLNTNASSFFKIGSLQISLKYGEDLFPEVPVKIFEIESGDVYIKFFLIADSANRKRGQIYALNARTNQLSGNLVFFNNGVPSKRPVLYSNTWNAIGLSFPGFLDIGGFVGALRITSPIMFNNFSFYQTTLADDEERFGFRQWFAVRSFLGDPIDWGYWAGKEVIGDETVPVGEAFDWQEVLFLSTTLREELDAGNIYDIYTGTNRTISESDQLFTLKDYQYSIFNGLGWTQSTTTPV